MRLVARLLVNAAALWAATRLVAGVTYRGGIGGLLAVALVFGLVNAILRPVVKLLSLPAMLLTLGLFTFVVNALMLWVTSALAGGLGIGFRVSGFGAAFLGALVVTVVSLLLSMFVPDDD
jgi:putative membrane protein